MLPHIRYIVHIPKSEIPENSKIHISISLDTKENPGGMEKMLIQSPLKKDLTEKFEQTGRKQIERIYKFPKHEAPDNNALGQRGKRDSNASLIHGTRKIPWDVKSPQKIENENIAIKSKSFIPNKKELKEEIDFKRKSLKIGSSIKNIGKTIQSTIKQGSNEIIDRLENKIMKEINMIKKSIEKTVGKFEEFEKLIVDMIPVIPKDLKSLQEAINNIEKYIGDMASEILGKY